MNLAKESFDFLLIFLEFSSNYNNSFLFLTFSSTIFSKYLGFNLLLVHYPKSSHCNQIIKVLDFHKITSFFYQILT